MKARPHTTGSVSLGVAQCEVKQLDRTLDRAQPGLTSVTAGCQLGSHNRIRQRAPVVTYRWTSRARQRWAAEAGRSLSASFTGARGAHVVAVRP
jgi:hypothetical protein